MANRIRKLGYVFPEGLTQAARVSFKDPASMHRASDLVSIAWKMADPRFYGTSINNLIKIYGYLVDHNNIMGLPTEDLHASITMLQYFKTIHPEAKIADDIYRLFAERRVEKGVVLSWILNGTLGNEFYDGVLIGYPEYQKIIDPRKNREGNVSILGNN